ncbi:hypothetical protein K9N08_03310 [Candidatus Gracilibacteria bacterium]|nr:hypothetical protein [Candidatus Gracilibacteria bacterium]MCF7896848.1 hypothetical protein [Candidatus Gracilibacteria bacterium]
MFNSLRNRVSDWLEGLARNPQRSSRAVFASILVVGMFALTLDLGPRMAPDYFGARLLDPLDRPTLEKALEDKGKINNDATEKKKAKEACAKARTAESYGTLLQNFEASFSGILPGAGNLLLEHPATVSDRREKLIFEMMKKYSNLKFCIPEDQFKLVYLTDYKTIIGQMNFFFQVVLHEKEQTTFNEDHPVFISTATDEYALVEKDLVSTHKYVTEVIDRAIASAVELDRWTEQRLNNLTAKTSNKLSLGNNELTKIGNDIANENVKVNSANSKILAAINSNTASIQAMPMNMGGGGQAMQREFVTGYNGEAKTSEVNVPNSGAVGSEKSGVASKYSFGILNLVDSTTRNNFLAGKLGESLAYYTAAINNLDPFTPGFEATPTSPGLSSNSIALHLCESIDTTAATCYSEGSIDSTAVAGSVGTTSISDSAIASGISTESNPVVTGQTTKEAPVVPQTNNAGIVKVDVVKVTASPVDVNCVNCSNSNGGGSSNINSNSGS